MSLSTGVYYIAESDKDGIPVEQLDEFDYEVTIDKAIVTLDVDQTEVVKITNKLDEEPDEPKKPEEPTKKNPTRTSSGVRTGDTSQPIIYLLVLLAAALAIGGIVLVRRRTRKS